MNDDLDDEIIGSEGGFDEFSQKTNIADSIRQNPAAKIGIVVAGVVVVVGAVLLFGQGAEEQQLSVLPQGSAVSSVPGAEGVVDPAYTTALEQQNEADLEAAIREGGSAVPMVTGTQNTRLEIPATQQEEEDPLHRWKVLQEERVQREMKSKAVDEEPVTVLNAEQQSEAITKLSDAMMAQMESILTAINEDSVFTTKNLLQYKDSEVAAAAAANADPNAAINGFAEDTEEEVVVPAGKVVYGQLLLEANSDVPSTVLAQMVSGPLKGWKLLGEFTVRDDIEMLSISFTKAVNEDGKQYDIDAVMLNPDTSLAALRTDVDHRYLKRVILPAAASFVEGFATALAETGRTSVTVDGGSAVEDTAEASDKQQVATGVEEAGQKVGEILDEMSDVPIKIVIAAGTPIGVFFTENVVETESDI